MKTVAAAAAKSVLASIPLWLIVPLSALAGVTVAVLLSPFILAAAAAGVSWLILDRAGVGGIWRYLTPLATALIVVVLPLGHPSVLSLGVMGTVTEWAVKGPTLLVAMLVAAFMVVFLASAAKVGMPAALIMAIVGAVLGAGIAVGALGVGPQAASVSTPRETLGIPLWLVAGAVGGGMATLLLCIFGKE